MKQEYILCAAIHYTNTTPVIPNQPKNIQQGFVVCGRRHHNIIQAVYQLSGIKAQANAIQGFLTSEDRFLTREEAIKLAVIREQLIGSAKQQLYSEDLY